MGHQMLCLSLIVLISLPQVTPLFFDLLGLGGSQASSPLEITEEDLESLQLQRLTEIQQVQQVQQLQQLQQLRQVQQLRELQGRGLYGAPQLPLTNALGPRNIPLLNINPIPLSQLTQGLGNLGIGGLGSPLGGLGRGRFRLLNENGLDRDGENEEPESKGILGGIRDTIGNLMGFRRSEDDEEEEFALPTGPRMEHHIHTYDIIPPPQLPINRPGLPFGLQALNPFLRNDVGLAPYGQSFAQPFAPQYPGGAYRNYY